MTARAVIIAGAVVLVILGGVAIGYAVGTGVAPDRLDANAARHAAYQASYDSALERSRARSVLRGREEGIAKGRQEGSITGTHVGKRTGRNDADQELASIAPPEPTTTLAPTSGLTYSPELPNGRPGYVLPEEQRSLACVGYDAATGECVGD